MKKLLFMSLLTVAALSLFACKSTPQQEEISKELPISQEEINFEKAPDNNSSEALPQEKFSVADASMYRGTVVSKDKNSDETLKVTLEQAQGTDFGKEKMTFIFDSNTKFSKEPEIGDYFEIYYGGVSSPENKAETAIAANYMMTEEAVIYNGTVKDIVIDSQIKGNGKIVLTVPNLADEEIVFNYNDRESKIYLNIDEVKIGDKLNILTNGMMTRSIPPQCFALEIRKINE